MGTVNRWDAEDYKWQMDAVGALYEACRERSMKLKSALSQDYTCHGRNYDPQGQIASSSERFIAAAGRLNNLYETMKSYMQEYNEMLANAQGTMENVSVSNEVYGTFAAAVAGGAAQAAVYEQSFLYQMYNTQQNYFDNYNDLWSFISSETFDEAFDAVGRSEMATYELYLNYIIGNNDAYAEERLEYALQSMLESLPDCRTIRLDSIDWEGLGAALGIENLAEYAAPLDKLLDEFRKNGFLSDEKMNELEQRVLAFKDFMKGELKDHPAGEMMTEGLDAILSGVEIGKIVFGPGVDLVNVLAGFFNTYTEQLTYLDSMQKGIELSGGWTEGLLYQKIEELKELYSDQVNNALGETLDIAKWVAGDIVTYSLTSQIPVLKGIDLGLKTISGTTAVFYGVDRIEAAKELMGFMQYDQVLTNSCKYYAEMMDLGIANAEDVAEADRLFEMLHATKIKEYEAIKTIAEDKNDIWFDLASDKLEELNKIDPSNWRWWESDGFKEDPLLSGRTDWTGIPK